MGTGGDRICDHDASTLPLVFAPPQDQHVSSSEDKYSAEIPSSVAASTLQLLYKMNEQVHGCRVVNWP